MGRTRAGLGTARRSAVVALIVGLAATLGPDVPAGAQQAPQLEIDPTSAPEGDDVTIMVSGTGCHEAGFTATVEVIFWGGSPSGNGSRFGSRFPGIVADEAGNWSRQIVVFFGGLPPLTPELSYSVAATCTLAAGDVVRSFDYAEVPFAITAAPADSTTTTTAPPTATTVPTPALAEPATPVLAEPSFTG